MKKKISSQWIGKAIKILESDKEMLWKKQPCAMIETSQLKLIRSGKHFPSAFGQNFTLYRIF